MNRREMIVGAGLAVATATATAAASRALADKPAAPKGAPTGLAAAANACRLSGEACLRHCLAMLATGNPSMAACAKAVSVMLPAVDALATIATLGSKHLAGYAQAVGEIVADCKGECDKHPGMAECKACADGCAAVLAAIKA